MLTLTPEMAAQVKAESITVTVSGDTMTVTYVRRKAKSGAQAVIIGSIKQEQGRGAGLR